MGKDLKGKIIDPGISQRQDGRYEARFTNRLGKRIRLYDTNLTRLKKQFYRLKDMDEDPKKEGFYITFQEWSETWLSSKKKEELRNVTIRSYATNIKLMNKYLSNYKLGKIERDNIIDVLDMLYEAGYAVKTIKGIKGQLYDIFQIAVDKQIINKNPCNNIKFKRQSREEKVKALTIEEQALFLRSMETSHYYEFVGFLLQTGLRISECLAIRWSDVDWDCKTLKIERAMVYTKVYGHYKKQFGNPKKQRSNRIIPLTDEAIKLLMSQKSKNLNVKIHDNKFDDMIFVTRSGNVPTDSNIRRIFKSKINYLHNQGYNIQNVTPHKLRHTFATRCLESGMNLKTVSTLLGHSRIELTADIYVDVQQEYAAEEIKKLQLNGLELSDEDSE